MDAAITVQVRNNELTPPDQEEDPVVAPGVDPVDTPGDVPVIDPAEIPGTDLEENQGETPVEDPETGLALEIGGVRLMGRGSLPERGTPPVLKEAADAAAARKELDNHKPINAL
ncbi:hypothetical protein MSG28_008629 [Choristoneura fumiferana]|uniref:Uncharacterized protein n=1 Tax=Choristoneura fumiferana TaxID=7141 RepID=A0ACC0J7F4_CHOFU|nr:hypothetical protein MSG28_008629 [Choristoneura fumiferana]